MEGEGVAMSMTWLAPGEPAAGWRDGKLTEDGGRDKK